MISLMQFNVSTENGFLPDTDPLTSLPPLFSPWEEVAAALPKLLVSDQLRNTVRSMPVLSAEALEAKAELERAMLLLSYLGHAYVWTEKSPPNSFPSPLAVPWQQIAKRLGRPPVLSYASYALHNWRRLDPQRPIELGNIGLLQNFLGGADEEWFVLVHVDIEAKAAPAIAQLMRGQEAAQQNDSKTLEEVLRSVNLALEAMYSTLCRMPEYCDPYIYYTRVRPYIHGWKDNPALPAGMLYEGVTEWAGRPQQFRGETGAQSTIVPSLDAFFGIIQKDDPLKRHLMDMRNYMPPEHRAFLEAVEQGPSIRECIRNQDNPGELKELYNSGVTWLETFRRKHLEYAARYIQQQKQSSAGNPTQVGTAGTPFMVYLKKHQTGTSEHLL